MTNKEQHYDCLLAALEMKRIKESGNHGTYESALFGFALKYSDLFKNFSSDSKFDYDRLMLLRELSEILPDYFSNLFNESGEVHAHYVSWYTAIRICTPRNLRRRKQDFDEQEEKLFQMHGRIEKERDDIYLTSEVWRQAGEITPLDTQLLKAKDFEIVAEFENILIKYIDTKKGKE